MSKEWKKGDKVKINQPELAGKIFTIEEISTEGVVFVTRGFQRLAVQERYLRGAFEKEMVEPVFNNLQVGDWVWINLVGASLVPHKIQRFSKEPGDVVKATLETEGGNAGLTISVEVLEKILDQDSRLIPGQYVGLRDHVDPPSGKRGTVLTSTEQDAVVEWLGNERTTHPNEDLYICAPYFQVGSPAEIAYYKGDWDKIHANSCNTEPLTPEADKRPPGFAWQHISNEERKIDTPSVVDEWTREYRRYEISRDIFLKSINEEWSKDLNVKVLAIQAVAHADTLLDALEGKI